MCLINKLQNVYHLSYTYYLAGFNTSYLISDSTQDILAKEMFKWHYNKSFYLWEIQITYPDIILKRFLRQCSLLHTVFPQYVPFFVS